MESKDIKENRQKLYLSILRKAPRLYRPAKKTPAPKDATETTLRYVLSPALGAFLRWLLLEALKSGEKRLYFLSRDGYFFYRAAKIFCRAKALPIDCRYLCCSRYTLRFPLLRQNRKKALDLLLGEKPTVTADMLLKRAGLTPRQREKILLRLQLPFSPSLFLSRSQLFLLRRRLQSCDLFFSYLNRRSEEAFFALSGYLRQEGLLDEIPFSIVDSGWTGSVQRDLSEILTKLGRKRPLKGYYWGLYELPKGADFSSYHSYFFSPQKGLLKKI